MPNRKKRRSMRTAAAWRRTDNHWKSGLIRRWKGLSLRLTMAWRRPFTRTVLRADRQAAIRDLLPTTAAGRDSHRSRRWAPSDGAQTLRRSGAAQNGRGGVTTNIGVVTSRKSAKDRFSDKFGAVKFSCKHTTACTHGRAQFRLCTQVEQRFHGLIGQLIPS